MNLVEQEIGSMYLLRKMKDDDMKATFKIGARIKIKDALEALDRVIFFKHFIEHQNSNVTINLVQVM